MEINQAVIVGGGIGGLCAAIALRQRGIAATVYEAAPQIKPAGAGILLAPNAMTILARLGLDGSAVERGIQLDKLGVNNFGILDTQGRMLVPGFALQQMRQQFGHGLVALTRAELHALLLQALPTDAVVLGKRLNRIEKSATGETCLFEDGSCAHGDVVIGADGLRSVVRQQLYPQVAPVYSGQTSHRGMLDWPLAKMGSTPCAEIWGARLRFGYTPVSSSRVYWYTTLLAAQGERDSAPAQAKTMLVELGEDMPPLVRELITATPDTAILRTDICDLPKLPCWHRDCIVLIGDAAHGTTPNLGQGGCQALEDGYALALSLSQADTLPHAFTQFEQLRKAKADQVTAIARQLGNMVHLRPDWQRKLRDFALRALPNSLFQQRTSAIYEVQY